MREIIFDTETTGLDSEADRVIEIGALELENRFPTGRTFHAYINPDGRPVHPDAEAVHGITMAMLKDKPVFAQIAEDFFVFCAGAKLVAHNASFDVAFINAEFARLSMPPVAQNTIVDTLAIARRKHPMGPNSLDALCKRYGIDNSHRTRHGALLDAELLAEVYIELLGGRQAALSLDAAVAETAADDMPSADGLALAGERPEPLPARLTPEHRMAHRAFVLGLGKDPLWVKLGLIEPGSAETAPRK